MPLKKSKGNMYPWVTHTHAHLGGECLHKCSYCYVNDPRFGRPNKFCGPLWMMTDELEVKYGKGRIIFIDHCNDLWAEDVPGVFIEMVLDHCAEWPENQYVFQTKNPDRYIDCIKWMPASCMLGCTIETNRQIPPEISKAPPPISRFLSMCQLNSSRALFVTIEPIMDFDVDVLGEWLRKIGPEFVNIGADSKRHRLPEPTADKIVALIALLNTAGIEIREKHNLGRLLIGKGNAP